MFLAVAGVIRCYDDHDTERYSPDTGSCVDTGQGRDTGTRHGLRQDQDLPPGKVQLAANLGPGNISKIQINKNLITGKIKENKYKEHANHS